MNCKQVRVAKERPIIFSTPMVRAILEGRKTQTRRIVGHPGLATLSYVVDCGDGWWGDEKGDFQARCPYGAPGDRLWVRETWQRFSDDGEMMFKADPKSADAMNELKRDECAEARWRSSIHMPRWASRITLEITSVRVERLQDISDADARAEGIVSRRIGTGDARTGCRDAFGLACDDNAWASSAIQAYGALWEQIYGPESWDANPLVWVVEFEQEVTA